MSAPGGRLQGKVAIVTGAARGQGAAEARAFAGEGAKVVVADVLGDDGRALADELGAAARFVELDVTDEAGWARAVAGAEEAFGPVSVLVNNAGILAFGALADSDPAQFRRVVDVNLTGQYLGIRAVVPSMRRAGGGSIVNISSSGGVMGLPGVGSYVASKWAVRGLTRTAALELGPDGIRVNCVCPGSIDTPMSRGADVPVEALQPIVGRLPVPRLGTVGDVVPLVVFLASDESGYCTGGDYPVDGGQTAGDLGFPAT